jgi:hemoglobin-like flavoprotein
MGNTQRIIPGVRQVVVLPVENEIIESNECTNEADEEVIPVHHSGSLEMVDVQSEDENSPVPQRRATQDSESSVSISSVSRSYDAASTTRHRTTGKITQLQLQVAFYTPCCFPMVPTVNQDTMNKCRSCWAQLMLPIEKDGQNISGLTVFYTEFYHVLASIDQGGFFERALLAHSSGINSIAAKGALIIRIVNFSLSIDPINVADTEKRLAAVGRTHRGYNIRPWMYQGFIEALLTTLQLVLNNRATAEIMSCWCNLFALVMQKMLPSAIDGIVHPHEMDANFSGHVMNFRASQSGKSSRSQNTGKHSFLDTLRFTARTSQSSKTSSGRQQTGRHSDKQGVAFDSCGCFH